MSMTDPFGKNPLCTSTAANGELCNDRGGPRARARARYLGLGT